MFPHILFTSSSVADCPQTLAITKGLDGDLAETLQTLALERGDLNVKSGDNPVEVVERSSDNPPQAPILKMNQGGTIEGHQPRKVRFSER